MTTSTFVSSTNATVHQSSFKARYWGDANSLRFLAENARTIDGKSAHWHLRARLRYWNVQQEGFRQQRVVNSPQHGQRYPGKRSQNDSWMGEKWQRGIRVGKGTMASNFAACFERSLWDKLNGQNCGSWSSHDDGVPFPRRWRHPNLVGRCRRLFIAYIQAVVKELLLEIFFKSIKTTSRPSFQKGTVACIGKNLQVIQIHPKKIRNCL